MGNFIHRMTDALLRSEYLPVGARMPLMRRLGYDIHPSACLWAGANLRSKALTIGPDVFINVGFFFDGFQKLEIAGNVRIGPFVRVITATHEIGPPGQRCTIEAIGGPVRIGKGSWIGCNVTLLPNVTVAEGCVIAAGAVVTRSTLPNGLYAGVPARLVRMLDGAVPPAMPAPLAPAC
ncbi:MAG: acyltransferase [Rhodospirillales bacterium]|nr:acyltransferase [Rhodospirillales bacterium]